MQWFDSMASYDAHMAEPDFPAIWDDISTFLDLDRLEFVVTAEPYVVFDRLDGATADVSP
jgi:hypothetical protein